MTTVRVNLPCSIDCVNYIKEECEKMLNEIKKYLEKFPFENLDSTKRVYKPTDLLVLDIQRCDKYRPKEMRRQI